MFQSTWHICMYRAIVWRKKWKKEQQFDLWPQGEHADKYSEQENIIGGEKMNRIQKRCISSTVAL